MTDREHWKELLPIIQAYVNGQTVQYKTAEGAEWIDVGDEEDFDAPTAYYRIKPEPKYRPFKSKEECWEEMLKHEPFGRVKGELYYQVTCVSEVMGLDAKFIAVGPLEFSPRESYEKFTFPDGAPFGIKEE